MGRNNQYCYLLILFPGFFYLDRFLFRLLLFDLLAGLFPAPNLHFVSSFSDINYNIMNSPDETRTFEKGKLELTTFKNGTTIGRITLEPGWSWDKCVKPIVKTNSCEAPHTQYMISGHIRVEMDDGSEDEFGPGDTAIIPPGHNAWVAGNEPVVGIDFTGLKDYAKEGGPQAHQA
jgi:quercetin dioxygenase-like cupin family protein